MVVHLVFDFISIHCLLARTVTFQLLHLATKDFNADPSYSSSSFPSVLGELGEIAGRVTSKKEDVLCVK